MIKLTPSSSNVFAFQPTASFADGSSFVYKFTDVFSQEEFEGVATGSKYGNWIELPITLSTSSIVSVNTSTLPLGGGTYELKVYKGVGGDAIWSTESRKWSLISDTWSTIESISSSGNAIWTSRAWVSESIDRMNYSSTNENAAYVVYQG